MVVAVSVPVAVAGCGSSSSSNSEDPSQVLKETFNNQNTINSGVLDLSLDGSAGSSGNVSAKLSGPFQGTGDTTHIPQVQWTASASGDVAGQNFSFDGGLTITSDNAYVTYKGQSYELGTQIFDQLQAQVAQSATAQSQQANGQGFTQACQQAVQQAGGNASVCEVDFSNWLTNVKNDGIDNVDGTDTIHVSGDANVKQIVTDIANIAQQLQGTSSQSFDPSQLDKLEPAVKSATIDVYSGESDKLLRKLDLHLTLDLAALSPGSAVPLGTVDGTFSLTLGDVNSTQTITAPSNTKPLSALKGAGALRSLGAGGAP
ncbi:MAG: hypothetical protein ACRDMH_03170 [Solirubrobacterales bacterium]